MFNFPKANPEVLCCLITAFLEYRTRGLSKTSRDHLVHAIVPSWQVLVSKSFQFLAIHNHSIQTIPESNLLKIRKMEVSHTKIKDHCWVSCHPEIPRRAIWFFPLEWPFYTLEGVFVFLSSSFCLHRLKKPKQFLGSRLFKFYFFSRLIFLSWTGKL